MYSSLVRERERYCIASGQPHVAANIAWEFA